MILVDTSVWIDHFRVGSSRLETLLLAGQVRTHRFVLGELACGSIRRRAKVLRLLHALPQTVFASDDEVMTLLENHKLYGWGLGWIDVHLLASALMTPCPLWTLDRALQRAARALAVSF